MNAASLLEVLNVPVAVAASSAQLPAQPLQAFKESLVLACRASLDAGAAHQPPTDAGNQQQAVAVDPKLSLSKPAVIGLPSLVVPQPVPVQKPASVQPGKQPSLLPTAIAQAQPIQAVQTLPAVYAALLAAGTKPVIVRPPAANPHSRPLSHLSQVTSTLTPATQLPQTVPDQTIAVANMPQNETGAAFLVPTLHAVASPAVSTVPTHASDTTASPAVKVIPTPTSITAASPAEKAVAASTPNTAESAAIDAAPAHPFHPAPRSSVNTGPVASSYKTAAPPEPAPTPAVATEPGASSPAAVSSTPAEVVVNPQPVAVPAGVPNAPAAEVPIAAVSATPTPDPSPAPNGHFPTPLDPRSVVAPAIASATVTKPFFGTVSRVVSDAIPRLSPVPVANVVKNAASADVSHTGAPLPPAPSLHDKGNQTAIGEAAPRTSPASAIPVDTPAASSRPNSGAGAPAAPTDPLVASIQAPLVTAQATTPGLLSANSKDGVVKAVSEATGLKQHLPATSAQDGLPAASQAAPQSGDQDPSQSQGQGGAAQQGQSTPPVPANSANHTFTATVNNAQSAAIAVPLQNAPALASPAGHSVKTPEPPAPAVSTLPQPPPLVNTARLIQTVGQSEMRVGMRSNDFGNISISTSATRDVISAQISLDHSELAKALATHVPEMQARLGGNQAMEVRIDMNGQATAQGGATSSGMSTASGDGSRGGHQPRGNAGPAPQSERGSVTATAAIPLAEAALNTRLDIRI